MAICGPFCDAVAKEKEEEWEGVGEGGFMCARVRACTCARVGGGYIPRTTG